VKRRRPDKDELALWRQVADTAKPLHPRKTTHAPLNTSALTEKRPTKQERALTPFQIGESAEKSGVSSEAMKPAKPPLRMDKKAFDRMKRGKLKPQSTLDLHGMTLDRAHDATTGFILRCHASDLRLVLIVTGKGKRTKSESILPERQGVLRSQLPHWLALPPLNQMVLQVTEAHGRHGGGGAFYVYLRRRR